MEHAPEKFRHQVGWAMCRSTLAYLFGMPEARVEREYMAHGQLGDLWTGLADVLWEMLNERAEEIQSRIDERAPTVEKDETFLRACGIAPIET